MASSVSPAQGALPARWSRTRRPVRARVAGTVNRRSRGAEIGELGQGAVDEGAAGRGLLVGDDLGVRDARVVIDGGVDAVETDAGVAASGGGSSGLTVCLPAMAVRDPTDVPDATCTRSSTSQRF
jgi:hypothetical protein